MLPLQKTTKTTWHIFYRGAVEYKKKELKPAIADFTKAIMSSIHCTLSPIRVEVVHTENWESTKKPPSLILTKQKPGKT